MNEMQAVNSAFVKLRRAVPLDSGQGKRVSKVVTTMVMVMMNNFQFLKRAVSRKYSKMIS